jgi:Domain of unknown function (DUF1508)
MSPPEEMPERAPGADDRVVTYEDLSGEWRWKRVAPNGEVVADSGEGYVNYEDCLQGAMRQGVLVTLDEDPEEVGQ